MSDNTLKKKEIMSSKNQHTSYNIIYVCKQTIVNGDKDLHNYNKTDLPGWFCINDLQVKLYFSTET